jgi:hypothetical protein
MKFTLTIELGNDAMQKRSHVAKALRDAAKEVVSSPATVRNEGRKIRDVNGNTVGEWKFEEE